MDQAQATRDLQDAIGLHRDGKLEQAAALCEGILRAYPRVAEPVQLLGLIRMRQRRIREAEACFRASADIAPKRADFQTNLANVLAAQGKSPEAEFVYHEALRLDAAFRPARIGLGRLYNRVGMYKAAEEEARALLATASDDAQALNLLGSALRHQEQASDSEAAFRQALRLRPGYGAARHNLGALLAGLYRTEEALEQYDAALRAGVRGAPIGVDRARALLALGRRDDAVALLADTVAAHPRAGNAHALLARLLHASDDRDYAGRMLEAAAAHPADTALQRTLALVLSETGRPDAAVEALRAAMAGGDADNALLAALADAHLAAGDHPAALRAAQEACRLAPGDPALKEPLVESLLALGRADEALPFVKAARSRSPLDQWHIACEATALRILGHERYGALYDYDRLVMVCELPVPKGWRTLREFNADLRDMLAARHRFALAPLGASVRGGSWTRISLIADPERALRAYRDALLQPIAAYRQRLGGDRGHPLSARNYGTATFGDAWSVRLQRGGRHLNHVHRDGWLSSAYYVAAPDADDAGGLLRFGEPRYPAEGVGVEHEVTPREGMLVLFPSYMWHGTSELASDEPRITLPFDVFAAGPRGAPA